MGVGLLPVWQQVLKYLKEGVSVIPIRDHDDEHGIAKTPFRGYQWKQFQAVLISEAQLFDDMDKLNTEAVAIICGKVSGNLEVIDVDVKYNPGIEISLFNDLKEFYPDLFSLLRIHETPSGGFHILYRCSGPVDGNNKLAKRKDDNGKAVCFIETRGEGGYVVAPPALKYSVRVDNKLPVITPEQRVNLLNLCRSYNLIANEETKQYKPTNQEQSYYSVNPFEDFNNRVDPIALVTSLGWKVFRQNHRFIWFTRPGKDTGTSMSFNIHSRFYYCFTSSTDLEPDHGYTPVNLISKLQFNNDKKQVHAYLTSNGYGRIKPEVEKRIISKALNNGGELPVNISPESRSKFEEEFERSGRVHPYGIFWFESERGGTLIDREKLLNVCNQLGYRLYNDAIYKIDEQILYKNTLRDFYDIIKAYIQVKDPFEYNEVCNAYEAFIEAHGKFTASRLAIIPEDAILHDNRDVCYKCYLNGVLRITSATINLVAYSTITNYILSTSLLNRDFNPVKDPEGSTTLFPEFLRLAISEITPFLMSVCGYLSHEYKDSTTGYIILLSEQVENPKDGGGSGKNIFTSLFENITTVHHVSGAQIKYDEKFLQSWEFERVLSINDALKNFSFEFLKELSTGRGKRKRLFSNEESVPIHLMPKFIVSTQFSFAITDGGIRRRVIPVEFTDFFTKTGGVDVHFDGKHFPTDWAASDWAVFDSFMAKAVMVWLKSGLKLKPPELSASGKAKQFHHTYGDAVTAFVKARFTDWVNAGFVSNEDFKKQLTTFFMENNIPPMFTPSMTKINAGITDFCLTENVSFKPDSFRKINMGSVRGKEFILNNPTPF